MSMIASEAEMPRKVMPKAFKHVVWRFIIFFIGSALCIGILVASNDPTLVAIYAGTKSGSGTAAA
jgi:amino acid transporter